MVTDGARAREGRADGDFQGDLFIGRPLRPAAQLAKASRISVEGVPG